MNTEMINTNDELTLDQLDNVSGGNWFRKKFDEAVDYVVGALEDAGEYIADESGLSDLVGTMNEATGQANGVKPLPDGRGDYNPGGFSF